MREKKPYSQALLATLFGLISSSALILLRPFCLLSSLQITTDKPSLDGNSVA
jgi:hypothetical protein